MPPSKQSPDQAKWTVKRLKAIWADLREIILPRRGVLIVSILLMTINRISGMVLPYSTRFLIDNVIGKKQVQQLVPMVLGIMAATLVQGATTFALAQLLSKTGHRIVFELRKKVQHHVGILPLSYYDVNKCGVLVSRIMSDVEGVRNLIGTGLLDFIGGLVTTLVAIVVLLRINFPMTTLVATFVVGYAYLSMWAFGKIRPIMRDRSKLTGEVTGRLTESLGGIRVVKGYHAEAREASVFVASLKHLLDRILAMVTTVSLLNLTSSLLVGFVGGVTWLIGTREILAGSLTVGELMTFIVFVGYLMAPISKMVTIGTELTEVFVGMDRTRELLNETPESPDVNRTVAIGPIVGDVVLEEVNFSYQQGKPVLRDVSFRAAPGTVTALVGSSGAGKSTIINLLAAFYKPDAGVVLVDGVDLSTVRLDTYRTQLGIVLQDNFLFDGTIAENVAFARPSANQEEILAACRTANVDEFVRRFEHKYDTVVGERGVKLSGGQRQRISIARAILADPHLLILDEATSSLDSESERLIQQGLKYLMKGRTTFVIAHRLSTIRNADQILVVEDGRIVERGTHESLCALGKRYWDLYRCQQDVEEDLFLAPHESDQVI